MIGDKQQGVTLIEILLAVTLFSIVIIGAVGLFISLIKNQQVLLDRAYVLNTLSYTTEYMSKAIRMAQKDITGTCLNSMENFILVAGDSSHIKFKNYNGDCQEFFLQLQDGILTLMVARNGVPQALTPANITVESLTFVLAGENQSDALQPKVSFSIKAKVKNSVAPSFLIQTTISQRMLDITY